MLDLVKGSDVMTEGSRTVCYIADTGALADRDLYDKLLKLVSSERREKAEQLSKDLDKQNCLSAELLLVRSLEDLGLSVPDLNYGYNRYGRPYLKNVPGFYFSISHSGSHVMLAAGDEPLGCDIEEIREARMNVAKRFFSSEEYDALMDTEDPEKRSLGFFSVWTMRESYIKALGRGLNKGLRSFDSIKEADGRYIVSEDKKATGWHTYLYQEIPGIVCSVTLKGKDKPCVEAVDIFKLIEGMKQRS